jgi:hypothetical protein
LFVDTNVSDELTASIFRTDNGPCGLVGTYQRFGDGCIWKQHVSPKRWNLPASPHGPSSAPKMETVATFLRKVGIYLHVHTTYFQP